MCIRISRTCRYAILHRNCQFSSSHKDPRHSASTLALAVTKKWMPWKFYLPQVNGNSCNRSHASKCKSSERWANLRQGRLDRRVKETQEFIYSYKRWFIDRTRYLISSVNTESNPRQWIRVNYVKSSKKNFLGVTLTSVNYYCFRAAGFSPCTFENSSYTKESPLCLTFVFDIVKQTSDGFYFKTCWKCKLYLHGAT